MLGRKATLKWSESLVMVTHSDTINARRCLTAVRSDGNLQRMHEIECKLNLAKNCSILKEEFPLTLIYKECVLNMSNYNNDFFFFSRLSPSIL